MKKTLLLITALLLGSFCCLGQVGQIKTEEKTYETIRISRSGVYIFHDFKTKIYELAITSDNNYEDKVAYINLGKTPEEVTESLKNMIDIINGESNTFKIGNLSCFTTEGGLVIYVSKSNPDLKYTAGDYYVMKDNLKEFYVTINNKYLHTLKSKLTISGVSSYSFSFKINYTCEEIDFKKDFEIRYGMTNFSEIKKINEEAGLKNNLEITDGHFALLKELTKQGKLSKECMKNLLNFLGESLE